MNLWEKNLNIRLLTRAAPLLCRASKLRQKTTIYSAALQMQG